MIAVSWDEFTLHSLKLAKMVEGKKFDSIIAISRGGLVLGRLLSDATSLKLGVVSAKAYETGKTGISSSGMVVDRKISIVGDAGRNVLLVDDIADSGATLEVVSRFLCEEHGMSVKSAVIFKKKNCGLSVDYAVISGTDDWIVMPYETREFRLLKDKLVKESDVK